MLIGINDIDAKCPQGKPFRKCQVKFRGNKTPDGTVRLSELDSINITRTGGGNVFCFSKGFKKEVQKQRLFNQLKNIALKDPYMTKLSAWKQQEEEAKIDAFYDSQKKVWASKNIDSNNDKIRHVATAINRGYDCDNEFAEICRQKDYPEFKFVEYNNFHYAVPCPSMEGLQVEEVFKKNLKTNNFATKYHTHSLLAWLYEIGEETVEREILIIFNYLRKHDIYAFVTDIDIKRYIIE